MTNPPAVRSTLRQIPARQAGRTYPSASPWTRRSSPGPVHCRWPFPPHLPDDHRSAGGQSAGQIADLSCVVAVISFSRPQASSPTSGSSGTACASDCAYERSALPASLNQHEMFEFLIAFRITDDRGKRRDAGAGGEHPQVAPRQQRIQNQRAGRLAPHPYRVAGPDFLQMFGQRPARHLDRIEFQRVVPASEAIE